MIADVKLDVSIFPGTTVKLGCNSTLSPILALIVSVIFVPISNPLKSVSAKEELMPFITLSPIEIWLKSILSADRLVLIADIKLSPKPNLPKSILSTDKLSLIADIKLSPKPNSLKSRLSVERLSLIAPIRLSPKPSSLKSILSVERLSLIESITVLPSSKSFSFPSLIFSILLLTALSTFSPKSSGNSVDFVSSLDCSVPSVLLSKASCSLVLSSTACAAFSSVSFIASIFWSLLSFIASTVSFAFFSSAFFAASVVCSMALSVLLPFNSCHIFAKSSPITLAIES